MNGLASKIEEPLAPGQPQREMEQSSSSCIWSGVVVGRELLPNQEVPTVNETNEQGEDRK